MTDFKAGRRTKTGLLRALIAMLLVITAGAEVCCAADYYTSSIKILSANQDHITVMKGVTRTMNIAITDGTGSKEYTLAAKWQTDPTTYNYADSGFARASKNMIFTLSGGSGTGKASISTGSVTVKTEPNNTFYTRGSLNSNYEGVVVPFSLNIPAGYHYTGYDSIRPVIVSWGNPPATAWSDAKGSWAGPFWQIHSTAAHNGGTAPSFDYSKYVGPVSAGKIYWHTQISSIGALSLKQPTDGKYYILTHTTNKAKITFKCAPNVYNVKYHANGGSGSMSDSVHTYDTEKKLTENAFSRTGYTFIGWNTKADGSGTSYESEASVKNLTAANGGTVTLYAQWDKTFDFSFEQTVSGIEFEKITADSGGNAGYSLALGHGDSVLIPGLNKGAGYQIEEENSGKYTPHFRVREGEDAVSQAEGSAGAGGPLLTSKEVLHDNTAFEFSNEKAPPDGVSLAIRKRLAGNNIEASDRSGMFSFRYMLKGLDPEETFTVDMSGATDEEGSPAENQTITPNADGTYIGTVKLHDGEIAVLENLTIGAQYVVGELKDNIGVSSGKAEYAAWYEVTDGKEAVTSAYRFFKPEELGSIFAANQMAASGRSGGVGAYAYETLQKGSPVEYTFTNAKYDYAPLTITKRITQDGEETDSMSSETFTVGLKLTGLEPETAYQSTIGTITSTAEGNAELQLKLRAGDIFTVQDLPCSVSCALTEDSCKYIPMLSVKRGDEELFKDTGEYGKTFDTSFTCHDQDVSVLLTNEKPKHADLQIKKEYGGRFSEEAEIADFTAEFTGLASNQSYSVQMLNADEEVFRTDQFIADADGTRTYQFSLKNRQTVRFLKLPTESRYNITETGKEGITPSYVLLSSDVDIKSKADSAEMGASLSTGFEKMTISRSYGFYNDLPDNSQKTVSDGDGLTMTGTGDEIELEENFVPTLRSSWVYHIKDKVDVPVASYTFHDILPPYVETTVFDPTAAAEDAPFRVYWENGEDRIGGAVTESDLDAGEYYIKDGEKTLFTILYDQYGTDDRGEIHVEMNDRDTLLLGDGKFDIYFKAYLRNGVTKEELIAKDGCYDGLHFTFTNDATTIAGEHASQTNPVLTRIPETGGLTVKKAVRGIQAFREEGKKFRFRADYSLLSPGETYSYSIPQTIRAQLVMENGTFGLEALDLSGKKLKDVTAKIYNDEERLSASLGYRSQVSLPPGDYRAVITRGSATAQTLFSIEESGNEKTFSGAPYVLLYSEGDTYHFRAGDDGKASIIFELTDGERAVFEDLLDETVYEITELAESGYFAEYVTVNGASYVNTSQADTESRLNRSLSTGRNVLRKGADVTFQYTNTMRNHKIKIRKIDTDGNPIEGALFCLYSGAVSAEISDGMTILEDLPNEGLICKDLITESDGYFRDDLAKNVRNGSLDLQPGEYTLFETEVPDDSGYQIAAPVRFRVNEDGTHQVWDPNLKRYGTAYDEEVGFTMIDVKRATPSDLILKKNVTGDLGDRTKQFVFTVRLEGLEGGKTYDEAADESVPADIVKSFIAEEDGTAEVMIKLRDDEEVCIPGIPCEASYKITESASDHVASYRVAAEGEEPEIVKASDTNGTLSAKALSTATETVDRGDGTVHIMYSNNRDYGALTGIPSYMLIWIIAGLLTVALAFIYVILKNRAK